MDTLFWGGLLLLGFVLGVGVLLTLQVWLAKKPRFLYGLIQPLLWLAIAAIGKLYTPATPNPALEPSSNVWGAIALAVVSLLVFAGVRFAARRRG